MDWEKKRLVPYSIARPGFEAVYTGAVKLPRAEEAEESARVTEDTGLAKEEWSTWTWTAPGQDTEWTDEIKVINEMQEHLGPLNEDVRRRPNWKTGSPTPRASSDARTRG